ncbi:MAG: 3-hydroxyacyl-ACP dehydratase FabZ family protein [Chthoniobacterales bacterium]
MTPVDPGLPHREPFVFVDEILERKAGEFARCKKTFPKDADFFRGHFPGNPIVPGVLLTEALAQTAGIAAANDEPGSQFLLSAIRSMKFPKAARPDEVITLEARKLGEMGGLLQFEVRAHVADSTIAEGTLILNTARS